MWNRLKKFKRYLENYQLHAFKISVLSVQRRLIKKAIN